MKNKINNWDDVCAFHKISTDALPDVSKVLPEFQQAVISNYKLMLAVAAINEGKKHDWNNFDTKKWYPVFDMEKSESNPSGFGFVISRFSLVGVRTRVAALAFATQVRQGCFTE